MLFAETQQHFDMLVVDEASPIPELEAGLLFPTGQQRVPDDIPGREPRRAPRRRPQRRVQPESMARQVAILSALRLRLPHLSEKLPHFRLRLCFMFCRYHSLLCLTFPNKKSHSPT